MFVSFRKKHFMHSKIIKHFQRPTFSKSKMSWSENFPGYFSWKCKSKGTLIKVMKRYHHFYLWKKLFVENVLLCCRRDIYKRICKRREKTVFYDKVTIPVLGFVWPNINPIPKIAESKQTHLFIENYLQMADCCTFTTKVLVRIAQSIFSCCFW